MRDTVILRAAGGEAFRTEDGLVLGGSGPEPMEILLAALGACSASVVSGILEKRRTPPESYRIELRGERAQEHPRRYTRITVRHLVRGEGITRRSLERAVALSERYCPVAATLGCKIESEAILLE